jgi:hypothetical protein
VAVSLAEFRVEVGSPLGEKRGTLTAQDPRSAGPKERRALTAHCPRSAAFKQRRTQRAAYPEGARHPTGVDLTGQRLT